MKARTSSFGSVLFIVCVGLLSQMQAVVPPPDGGYPGFNTAEGQNALLSLNTSTGVANTAVGWFSLKSNVDASFNTAVGAGTLLFNIGDQNTALGAAALLLNTSGFGNTAVGVTALLNNTQGNFNTATGNLALQSNTTGVSNTATGYQALFNNTTGSNNTASGLVALHSNSAGDFNTATGSSTLFSNTDGSENTASGFNALAFNTEGSGNTATGSRTLVQNSTGSINTANGLSALEFNSTGQQNTANGAFALFNNTIGSDNTATGHRALRENTTGNLNTAMGRQALLNNNGSGNTVVGYSAGINLTTGDDNICIGNDGVAGEGGVIRIGRNFINSTYIAGIFNQVSSGGTAVFVNSDGKLGTTTSSKRFKNGIKPMGQASEALFALKPVTFHYNSEIDSQGIVHFGLVAEDVEAINPDLVVRDSQNRMHTVRYDQINAMLLNEFLKQHQAFVEEQHKVKKLEATVASLVAMMKEQAAQIHKMNVHLEADRRAMEVVSNDRQQMSLTPDRGQRTSESGCSRSKNNFKQLNAVPLSGMVWIE